MQEERQLKAVGQLQQNASVDKAVPIKQSYPQNPFYATHETFQNNIISPGFPPQYPKSIEVIDAWCFNTDKLKNFMTAIQKYLI